MISVCMTTFNGEKYIKEQIESILLQMGSDDELIISDDSSADKTIEIINSFNDERISIYENSFRNLIKNFEFTIKKANGEYIFLSDQDDVWLVNKVKNVLAKLEDNNCVLHDAKLVDDKLLPIGVSLFEINKSKKGILKNIIKNSYVGCCLAFDKSVLSYILPFPKGIPMHDSWIGLMAEKKGRVYHLTEELILYRRHDKNASNTGARSYRSFVRRIEERIVLLINLIKR